MTEAFGYNQKQPDDNLRQTTHVTRYSEACLIVASSNFLEVLQMYICIFTGKNGVLSFSGRRTSQRDAGFHS